MQASTHEFGSLVQRVLRAANGSLALFSGELGDLVEFLAQVGLDEFKLGFVVAEELRACVCVDWVGHGCSRVRRDWF